MRRPGAIELPWLLVCTAGAALAVALFVAPAREATAGEPVPPLDDTYIHFQYARSIAEGHPFRYHPADEPSSGATSPVYALLLALFYLLGWKGQTLLGPAVAIGIACLGLATHSLSRLAARLGGPGLRIPVILGLLGWGWLGWHVASGMEGALALAVMAIVFDRSHLWITDRSGRTGAGAGALIAVALLLPLIRPAAMFLCAAIALMLLVFPARGERRMRWLAIAPLGGFAVSRLFWTVVAGQSLPNGAAAKWLLVHPVKPRDEIVEWILQNVKRLGGWVFGISVDAAPFYVPPIVFGAVVVIGLLWVLLRRRRREELVWACFPWAIVAGFAGLMTYGTYAQHFFRYTTPYAPLLFAVGLAPVGLAARKLERRWSWLRGSHLGAFVPLLIAASMAITLPAARAAFVGATRDIAGQHVVLAGDLRRLPPGAIVGVTDAGALAYLGGHRTVDLIGLTTNRASDYYLSGAGSQLELVESLPPEDRPTHYATYRGGWYFPTMSFGPSIAEARIGSPTIVGGPLKELWPRERTNLGIGEAERPLSADTTGWRIVDSVDVADVDDERAHDYAAPNRYDDDVIATLRRPEAEQLAEGGRRIATEESFHLRARPGQPMRLVGRVHAPGAGRLRIEVGGEVVGELDVPRATGWTEVAVDVPGGDVGEDEVVTVRRLAGPVTSFHWWSLAPEN